MKTKTLIRNLLLVLFPLIAGVGVYLVVHARNLPAQVPMLIFKADLGSALIVVGGILSLLGAVGVACWAVAASRTAQRCHVEMEAAQHADEDARRRFIRQLDHALKNPLTGLRAALTNLSVDYKGAPVGEDKTAPGDKTPPAFRIAPVDKTASNALADAYYQVNRLSHLVADLRKLADLEERPLESAPVDIAAVLAETVEAVSALPQYEERTVNFVISRVPWPLPPVTGDRDLLGLAFYNLVENALKYTGSGDAVEVRAVEDGRWLNIEVADSGPGIAEKDLPRVFEELYRGENARGQEGSGLGLALVRRVVDRHNGSINIRSRVDGQRGTVFRVRLPVK